MKNGIRAAKINLMSGTWAWMKYPKKSLAYLDSWFEFTFSFQEKIFPFSAHFSASTKGGDGNGNEKFHKLFKLALVKYISEKCKK